MRLMDPSDILPSSKPHQSDLISNGNNYEESQKLLQKYLTQIVPRYTIVLNS